MSRSRRKTDIIAIVSGSSDKRDKQIANRKFRRRVKEAIRLDSEVFPMLREVSNVYDFNKDGSWWYFGHMRHSTEPDKLIIYEKLKRK